MSFRFGLCTLAAVDRVLAAYRHAGRRLTDAGRERVDAIRAVELHRDSCETSTGHLRARVIARGVTQADAGELSLRPGFTSHTGRSMS